VHKRLNVEDGRHPRHDRRVAQLARSSEPESLKDETRHVLDEARMVLPGIQALFGFQLIAVFNDQFARIAMPLKLAHFTALALVVVSIALIMSLAAYDRIAQRGVLSKNFVDLASRFMTWAMVPLVVAIATELFVVTMVVTDSVVASSITVGAAVVLYVCLWFVMPLRAIKA
jgi:hypothetical protein